MQDNAVLPAQLIELVPVGATGLLHQVFRIDLDAVQIRALLEQGRCVPVAEVQAG